ncbi:MAG: hypothetical protein ACQEQU_02990 [Spirochaetota bacterium]
MINNEVKHMELYAQLSTVVEANGFYLIEVSEYEKNGKSTIRIVIQSKAGNTTIDHCATVHHLILPRLEVLRDDRDVYLEVSTPGIQRNIKDVVEFKAFIGKRIKVLSTREQDWLEGILFQVKENSIMIATEQRESRELPFEEIQKAKLVYNWEDKT